MEKQSKQRTRRFLCHRLLKAFFAARVLLFAPAALNAQNAALVFVPNAHTCFVSEDIVYSLAIPGMPPSEITLGTPRAQGLVQQSLQKTGGVVDGKTATIIRIAFNAREPGIAVPEPLWVSLKGTLLSVPFAPVTVLEDPQKAEPAMTVKFQGGGAARIHEGSAVLLLVEIQNARQIESFEWVLTADSMLREISRNGHSVLLEWLPLAPGEQTLPRFTARVKNLTGTTQTILLDGVMCTVFPPLESVEEGANGTSDSAQSDAARQFLQNAFETP